MWKGGEYLRKALYLSLARLTRYDIGQITTSTTNPICPAHLPKKYSEQNVLDVYVSACLRFCLGQIHIYILKKTHQQRIFVVNSVFVESFIVFMSYSCWKLLFLLLLFRPSDSPNPKKKKKNPCSHLWLFHIMQDLKSLPRGPCTVAEAFLFAMNQGMKCSQ